MNDGRWLFLSLVLNWAELFDVRSISQYFAYTLNKGAKQDAE